MANKDTQIGGDHYQTALQPVEFIMANELGLAEGCVVKYVFRHKSKNGIEDLKKAKHYLEVLIEDAEKTGLMPITMDNRSGARQVGGSHYQMAIQPLEFIQRNNIPYVEGNIIKYVCRYKFKNGIIDLKKALHYLGFLLEKGEPHEEVN